MHQERHDAVVTEALADIVRDWPDVRRRKLFGHPGFLAGGKVFAALHRSAVLLLRLAEDARATLERDFGAGPFFIDGAPVRGWIRVPAEGVDGVLALGPWLHDAYEAALEAAGRG
jgi:TfoX/Sxy family transcriptional regulator of competence genes